MSAPRDFNATTASQPRKCRLRLRYTPHEPQFRQPAVLGPWPLQREGSTMTTAAATADVRHGGPYGPAREPRCSDWRDDGAVTESWITIPVTDVRPGDRVRLASGQEVLVSRIGARFLGREKMVAFIE